MVRHGRSASPRALSDVSSPAPIPFATVARFFRLRFVNGTTELTNLLVQVFGTLQPIQLTATMGQTIETTWPVQAVRVVNDANSDIAARLRDGVEPVVWVTKGTVTNSPLIVGPAGWVGTTAQITTADTLRVKAGGNANDDRKRDRLPSSGARVHRRERVRVVESLNTAGASASAATSGSAWRLLRAAARLSGTYGGVAGSNAADITIETSGGVVVGVMPAGIGESEMGLRHIPAGSNAIIRGVQVFPEGNKSIDLRLMRFDRSDITSAPYRSVREVFRLPDVDGDIDVDDFDFGTFGERTDLYWVGRGRERDRGGYDHHRPVDLPVAVQVSNLPYALLCVSGNIVKTHLITIGSPKWSRLDPQSDDDPTRILINNPEPFDPIVWTVHALPVTDHQKAVLSQSLDAVRDGIKPPRTPPNLIVPPPPFADLTKTSPTFPCCVSFLHFPHTVYPFLSVTTAPEVIPLDLVADHLFDFHHASCLPYPNSYDGPGPVTECRVILAIQEDTMILDFAAAFQLGLRLWPILTGVIAAAKEDSEGGKKITANELAALVGDATPVPGRRHRIAGRQGVGRADAGA